ncbi:MAG: GNAT family N-acetyltransferase [Armatimonadota bacterium]
MITYTSLDDNSLAGVHQICSTAIHLDTIPLDWFRYKTLGDPNFDPRLALVAKWDNKPVGFMMGVVRPGVDGPIGGIKLFAVQEQFRNQGIASALLSGVEAELKKQGAKSVTVGFTRPSYIFAGVDPTYTEACAFLLRRGYAKRGEAFNMDVDLDASEWSTSELEVKLARQGITCKRMDATDVDKLLGFFKREGTSSGWQYQVRNAYEQNPSGVFIALKDDRVIAFSCYDGVRPMWFGPMATAQEARGGGIGSLTFLKCLQAMKAQGYPTCFINSVGPLYFYSKVAGARVSRVFWQFDKQLDTDG